MQSTLSEPLNMINYPKATIAIIGGSGLYEMEGLTGAEQVNVDTPYGNPSDAIMVGELDGVSSIARKIMWG